ncbi:MAG: hypothetical protein ACYDG6_08950 [Thermincolia bacterium]
MFFGMWNSEKAKGFWMGVGTVVAGFVLIPALRNSLRPMAVKTVQGAITLKEQGEEFINEIRGSRSSGIVEKEQQQVTVIDGEGRRRDEQ